MKHTAFETSFHASPASQDKDDCSPKAALRESESMPLECLEAAGIGSYVVDLIGNACNSSVVLNSLFGIPQQEKHPLEIWWVRCKPAVTALTAYEEKKEAIRLVILDLGMPGMGGRRCLRELRRLDPGVKVLVASGYHETGLVDDVLKNGATGFIHKPYQIRDLAVRVLDVLDRGRQEDGEV